MGWVVRDVTMTRVWSAEKFNPEELIRRILQTSRELQVELTEEIELWKHIWLV